MYPKYSPWIECIKTCNSCCRHFKKESYGFVDFCFGLEKHAFVAGPQPASHSRVGESSTFLIFPQIAINFPYFSSTFLIFFLILALWVGELSTQESPGYSTGLWIIWIIVYHRYSPWMQHIKTCNSCCRHFTKDRKALLTLCKTIFKAMFALSI